jgi:hypothetical protein
LSIETDLKPKKNIVSNFDLLYSAPMSNGAPVLSVQDVMYDIGPSPMILAHYYGEISAYSISAYRFSFHKSRNRNYVSERRPGQFGLNKAEE